jgi:hypothetical protein
MTGEKFVSSRLKKKPKGQRDQEAHHNQEARALQTLKPRQTMGGGQPLFQIRTQSPPLFIWPMQQS